MLGLFGSLKNFVAFNKVTIDNGVFVLHYKVTVLILLVCTLLVSCKQHFGDPITCIADNNDVKFGKAVDAYCWVHSTYTVKELMDGKVGSSVLRPGVGPHTKQTSRKFHGYYQWVAFFLMFQAGSFYFPRLLWKLWEEGRIKVLSMNLETQINFTERDLAVRRKAIVNYLLRHFHRQNCYAIKYMMCEMLNVINAGLQIFLTDKFLGHEFSTYGKEALNFMFDESFAERSDPMDRVFPKVSKCTFNQFGPTGNIVPYDTLCILPLNILNEKIFIFLWVWFIFVAVASCLGVFYRISTVAFSSVRKRRLLAKGNLCEEFDIQIVSLYTYFGDWLVLHQLSKNMDPLVFADILRDLAYQLKKYGKKSFEIRNMRECESKSNLAAKNAGESGNHTIDYGRRNSTTNIYDLVTEENVNYA